MSTTTTDKPLYRLVPVGSLSMTALFYPHITHSLPTHSPLTHSLTHSLTHTQTLTDSLAHDHAPARYRPPKHPRARQCTSSPMSVTLGCVCRPHSSVMLLAARPMRRMKW